MTQNKNFVEKRLLIDGELHKKIKIIATLKNESQERTINQIIKEWMDDNYTKIVEDNFNK